ncbi:MAG: hypothetical protein WA053_02385 [Minisyncoccia bacterium]
MQKGVIMKASLVSVFAAILLAACGGGSDSTTAPPTARVQDVVPALGTARGVPATVAPVFGLVDVVGVTAVDTSDLKFDCSSKVVEFTVVSSFAVDGKVSLTFTPSAPIANGAYCTILGDLVLHGPGGSTTVAVNGGAGTSFFIDGPATVVCDRKDAQCIPW